MYLRPEVIVSDWSTIEQFLQDHPLGLLTTTIPVAGQSTIQASHLPFLYTPPASPPEPTSDASTAANSVNGTWKADDLGTLRCHLARANPQAKALLAAANMYGPKEEVLIVFASPINIDGYISPQWYKATKPDSGKTVPTWNYCEVQIYGTVTALPSPHEIVTALSDKHEARYAEQVGKEETWKVSDAPDKYIEILEKTIMGVEIRVKKLGAKFKMSREKLEGDWNGVVEGLKEVGADGMADMVQDLGRIQKQHSVLR